MKINISGLMNIIADEERKLRDLSNYLQTHIYSISIQELNGTINIMENYKNEFEETLKKYNETITKISKLKYFLYEKNNSFKLSDNRTIQEAINDNTNLRKKKGIYDQMLIYRNTKRRITEVNNSYFECKTVNFDINKIKKESDELETLIQNTDFEISKLNSIEFEIDI